MCKISEFQPVCMRYIFMEVKLSSEMFDKMQRKQP